MARKQGTKSVPALINDKAAETVTQRVELVLVHIEKSKKGDKILATLGNLRAMLNHYGIVCRYDVIKKRLIHIIPGEEFSTENEEEAALACIYSCMKENRIPVDGYKLYLVRIADENQFNPVLQYVRSKPWDRVDRMPEFCATIESPETEAKNLLIRRWMITAMSMALYNGIDGAGCLVLQGPPDLGKTWWVKKLVPQEIRENLIRTDATVDPGDKDQVSQVISYWIVELGEIGATFRKAELQALKGFITRDHDTMRRPYGEGDKRFPRRTALIASVDQFIYLIDTAGNRRFWTIPCTKINSYHEIDMQQVWAQVLSMIEAHGETWRLTQVEKDHIKRINEEHMQIDPIMEMIQEKYKWEELAMVARWETATKIGEEIGLIDLGHRETRLITGHVLKLNGGQKKRTGDKRYLLVPALRPS